MTIIITSVNEDAPSDDPDVWDAVREVAGRIAWDANRGTTAPVGITYEPKKGSTDTVTVGPTGAAAIAVEFGTAHVPARRYMKRSLDRHRQ